MPKRNNETENAKTVRQFEYSQCTEDKTNSRK